MNKFHEFLEQLMVVLKPSSDAVSDVTPVKAPPVDMFTGTADNILSTLQPIISGIQPDSNIGETGLDDDKNNDKEADLDVQIERNEKGVTISFEGLSFDFPESVLKAIVDFVENNPSEDKDEDDVETNKNDTGEEEDDDDEEKEVSESQDVTLYKDAPKRIYKLIPQNSLEKYSKQGWQIDRFSYQPKGVYRIYRDDTGKSNMTEGYHQRGKRDGTGPFKGSYRNNLKSRGKRRARKQSCPWSKKNETKN